MRKILIAIVAQMAFSSIAFGCGFRTHPIELNQAYLEEGWRLPGISGGNIVKYKPAVQIPGLSASIILYENPYIAEFPSVEFDLNGKRHRMPSQQMRLSGFLGKAWVIRWQTDDAKAVAYTYMLVPVSAHRSGDKWTVDSEVGCVFDTTFIDDKGDGLFRVMVDGDMRPDLIPAWAKKSKS